jgi:hypothetical protein
VLQTRLLQKFFILPDRGHDGSINRSSKPKERMANRAKTPRQNSAPKQNIEFAAVEAPALPCSLSPPGWAKPFTIDNLSLTYLGFPLLEGFSWHPVFSQSP